MSARPLIGFRQLRYSQVRLLPAGTVKAVDRDEEKVYVNHTKEQIENAPEFDEDTYRDEKYRAEVGDYYAGGGASGDRTTEKEAAARKS